MNILLEKLIKNKDKIYLNVSYLAKDRVKELGAKWDPSRKQWYISDRDDKCVFYKWLPDELKPCPREEFKKQLDKLNCIVTSPHPIMDGQTHRIKVVGDKDGEAAAAYVLYNDGFPAGYIKNYRTGEEIKWKISNEIGVYLNKTVLNKLKDESFKKLKEKKLFKEKDRNNDLQKIKDNLLRLKPVTKITPYLATKGISYFKGIYTNYKNELTYIPVYNIEGSLTGIQCINSEGSKRFFKNSITAGCFHIVGNIEDLNRNPIVIIAEGYATAATLMGILNVPIVCAFYAGNLKNVAVNLKEKFPEKHIIIAGDDDKYTELTTGVNPGKVKAIEAAKAVGGDVIFPLFLNEEIRFPTGVSPVTPAIYLKHQKAISFLKENRNLTKQEKLLYKSNLLDSKQLESLNKIKQFSDFNDLIQKSSKNKLQSIQEIKHNLKSLKNKLNSHCMKMHI